ncbi:MAG: hypothetical protein ACD_49C00069G0002 [uncultured bacterium (gcode 4)]|uniref:Cysteine--tRNA ligase n=1 Tax=uncultured bacterium (gcode 4) TaxID=1234023 RepID=K2BUR4_9BACT|nr:MAG: hypothetical protein ACD_49C00069G0002 [uncultured bacterium (gcode 4)]
MQLTNTLTRAKEEFKPLKQDKIKIYYCGPTPYNYAHIGNLRAYLFSDMVIRTLRFLGYKAETTMNITDIDDKTIRDSQKERVDLMTFTQKYTKFFLDDLEKLRIKKADNISPISQLIPEMVEIINWLLTKWYAYLADDGSIYYSISKFKNYGQLAHLDFAWMKSSVRINNDEYEKDEVADFALWKAYNEQKDWPNKWEGKFIIPSPLTPLPEGEGNKEITIWWRPGWHIECSACNLKFFGPQIDLHMGGIDNIFPHHQNEIAQSEAYTGKVFSKYWMHNWHVLVNNKKMSKSAHNFYTLLDVEEKMKSEASLDLIHRWYRFMSYGAKYSDSFNFTFDKLRQAITNIRSFDEVFKRIKNYKPKTGKTTKEVSQNLQNYITDYISALEDDFNTVEALVPVFEFVKYINSGIDNNSLNSGEIEATIWVFKTFNEVLDIFDFNIFQANEEIPTEILDLLNARNKAKTEKNYNLSDEIRDKITNLWYKIIDDKQGSRAEKI